MASDFKVGDRVEMTIEALEMFQLRDPKSRYGVVVGFSTLSDRYIRVQRDGLRNPERWAATFWVPKKDDR